MSNKAVGGCILLLLFVCCLSPTRAGDSSSVSDLPVVRALDPPYVAVAGGTEYSHTQLTWSTVSQASQVSNVLSMKSVMLLMVIDCVVLAVLVW